MTYSDTSTSQSSLQSWALVLGRVLFALVFVPAGLMKIGDVAGTAGYIESVGLPLPMVGVFVAIAIEVLAGLALLAGFKTRLAAWLLAGFTLAAAVFFHSDFADQMQMGMFFKNLGIVGGLLFVAVFGPGKISIDRG